MVEPHRCRVSGPGAVTQFRQIRHSTVHCFIMLYSFRIMLLQKLTPPTIHCCFWDKYVIHGSVMGCRDSDTAHCFIMLYSFRIMLLQKLTLLTLHCWDRYVIHGSVILGLMNQYPCKSAWMWDLQVWLNQDLHCTVVSTDAMRDSPQTHQFYFWEAGHAQTRGRDGKQEFHRVRNC
jgi:hypothetical protein